MLIWSSIAQILVGSLLGIVGTCLVFWSKMIRYFRLKKGLIYEVREEASITARKKMKELKREIVGFGFQIMAFIILAWAGIFGLIYP